MIRANQNNIESMKQEIEDLLSSLEFKQQYLDETTKANS